MSDRVAVHGRRAVLLILVGVPGSGKSTFCSGLISQACRPWMHICQDAIGSTGKRGDGAGGGKRGTKLQCLKKASAALAEGCSVVVDRCNIDKKQREEFVELGRRAAVEVHALVLDFPLRICIQRASQRVDHEGGVQGPGAAPIVHRFGKSKELPDEKEGFVRVTICGTDGEVRDALNLYRQLDSAGSLPAGVFGAGKGMAGQSKLQNFFQTKDKNSGTGSLKRRERDGTPRCASGNFLQTRDKKCGSESLACRQRDGDGGSCGASDGFGGALAFPSISTGDFEFDHALAADVIVETASMFLRQAENAGLRLIMVDVSPSSDMLSRVRIKAAEAGLEEDRFAAIAGDITKMKSSTGTVCQIIANETNWRLSGSGGGDKAGIYRAAGKEMLDLATKRIAKTLAPGNVFAVPLPSSCPLRRNEGVTHVIHVVGPNFNPRRPNCLHGESVEGCNLLRQAYQKLFQSFATAVQSPHPSSPKRQRVSSFASKSEAGFLELPNDVEKKGQGRRL